jgi:hypothetical protein
MAFPPFSIEMTTKRLKNYQLNPTGDFIADQVWLR